MGCSPDPHCPAPLLHPAYDAPSPLAQGSASGGDMSAVEQLEAQLKGILASLNKIDVVGQVQV